MMQLSRFVLFAGFVTTGSSAFAANLIPNPDFTQWLIQWTRDPAFKANFGIDPTQGSPSPPSAHVSGNGAIASGSARAACLTMDDAAHVDLRFNTLVVAGVVQGYVNAYSDSDCTDAIGVISTETVEPSSDWKTLSLTDAALPLGTKSVAISIHALSADGTSNGDAYFDHVAFGLAGSLSPTIPINQQGLTGAWFDPAASGQGLQFSIDMANGFLFGAWYTYDAVAGGTETQRWYSMDASLAPDATSANVTIYRNTGGAFASPPSTMAVPVGTGTLAFDSCTSGTFAYAFDDGRIGSIDFRSALPQRACAETFAAQPPPGLIGLSGAWYDASMSGQGVMIDVDTFAGAAFAGWYTYVPAGGSTGADAQRWFSLQGAYGKGPQAVDQPVDLIIYASSGGTFGHEGAATTIHVGTATLRFDSCEHASLDYAFTDGDLAGWSGVLDLVRLGQASENCDLTP